MIDATIMHRFVIGGSPVPAVVVLALSTIVAIARRDQISAVLGLAYDALPPESNGLSR